MQSEEFKIFNAQKTAPICDVVDIEFPIYDLRTFALHRLICCYDAKQWMDSELVGIPNETENAL